MINLKNYINLHFLDFLIVLLNIFYFLPKTIEWLNWDSGITMGYVGIELIFNYLIHIFFIYSCNSLLIVFEKKYKLFFFILIYLVSFISFYFSFRIIGFFVFIPILIYIRIFNNLIKNINGDKVLKKHSILSFIVSLIWLFLDKEFLT